MGMIFKGLTFGGVNSLDYGIFITGEAVYNAPERSVTSIEIEGRNGDLLIDNGRFLNIEVSYPAGCFAETQQDFKEKIELFRNAIVSQISYQRLTDDYNPDEYRLAVYKSGLDVNVAVLHQGGEFTLTFDCKPQRFLTSGETERSIPEWSDLHTDSGSLVTVDNSGGEYAVKSLSTDIVPQQNLNGYDHPWAAGAGKNKMPNNYGSGAINGLTVTKQADGSYKINGTASANTLLYIGNSDGTITTTPFASDSYILNGCPSGGSSSSYRIVAYLYSGSTYLNVARSDTGSGVSIDLSSGDGMRVAIDIKSGTQINNLIFKPMIRLSTVSDATYEPYSNICPITGFDSVNVTRAGKNLLDNKKAIVVNNIYLGTDVGLGNYSHSVTLPAGTYTLSVETADGTVTNLYVAEVGSSSTIARKSDAKTLSFSLTDTTDLRIWVYKAGYSTVGVGAITQFQLEQGSIATDYEPYQGTTYPVNLSDTAGTVYGGTLDVVSGQLTVERAFITLDETANWSWSTVTLRPHVLISGMEIKGAVISNMYPYSSSNVAVDGTITTNAGNGNDVWIYDTVNAPDLNSWKTFVESNNLQVVYTLATPLTYQLTATQVAFLLGTNNLWSNTGDIQIEYGKGGNTLFNPTLFDSKPLLVVTGYGNLGINSQTLTIENGYPSQVVYIDCDSMEAWTETGGVKSPANDLIQNAGDAFPTLKSGMNAFGIPATITALKVTPRWWRI